MAGRPLKMAEKITALETKMDEVHRAFLEYMPDQYTKQPQADPLGEAWYAACQELFTAQESLEVLAEVLREKAGVTWAQTKTRIAELQGQSPAEEPAAESAEEPVTSDAS